MTELAIIELNEFKENMAKLKDTANFIPDVSDDDGYQKSKRVSLDIGKVLTSLEKVRKEKKAYFLEGGREVDRQSSELKEALELIQSPHKIAYKELDNQKKEREAKRKAELEERVEFMRLLPENMADSCSDEIAAAIEELKSNECLDFYEFTEQALKARNKSVSELSVMFAKVLQAEKDAEELAKLKKAEAERQQKEHEESIKKEAAAKAEAEKQAAIERENEAKRQAEQAEIDKLAAEKEALETAKQAAIDKKDAESRAIQAEKDAEMNAKIAAEKARGEELARQKAELEAEIAETEKREANKRHVGNIRKEAKEALMKIGISEDLAKKAVLAINSDEIPHVSISY